MITDYGFVSLDPEKAILEQAGYLLEAYQCKTPEDVLRSGKDADALLVQWAPVTREVIRELNKCKIIVRYGIGTDNVDLEAAKERGIPVCNVPDYCIDEVADHTMSIGLALGRQLKETEMRIHQGIWKIMPPRELPAFREMIFATAGFGRIAKEVLNRARGFKFSLASYDPFVPEEVMKSYGIRKLNKEELFHEADFLSLHLPLNQETYHFIGKECLMQMKNSAFLINTSRGGIVDTIALAEAISQNEIGGAGLDVFEEEPLPLNHPLRKCDHTILTSHAAWYSKSSGVLLQRKAAEEIVKGLNGITSGNRVN